MTTQVTCLGYYKIH